MRWTPPTTLTRPHSRKEGGRGYPSLRKYVKFYLRLIPPPATWLKYAHPSPPLHA